MHVSQMLQSVLCITTRCVFVVLLHVCFSIVNPIPFRHFFLVIPIGGTIVLPDSNFIVDVGL